MKKCFFQKFFCIFLLLLNQIIEICCGPLEFFCLGGQYYDLDHPTVHKLRKHFLGGRRSEIAYGCLRWGRGMCLKCLHKHFENKVNHLFFLLCFNFSISPYDYLWIIIHYIVWFFWIQCWYCHRNWLQEENTSDNTWSPRIVRIRLVQSSK